MGMASYDRLGREVAVVAEVERFSAKVLADPRTRPFFEAFDVAADAQASGLHDVGVWGPVRVPRAAAP